MKKILIRIGVFLAFLVVAAGSYFAGSSVKERERIENRQQRCVRLISFAIDKVENHNLSDDGVIEALISNLYATHEFCDDPQLAAELNDLWNTLIYRKEQYVGKEDALAEQLRGIAERILRGTIYLLFKQHKDVN